MKRGTPATKRRLLSAKGISHLLDRLAAAIRRRNRRIGDLALVGIKRRGVPLAKRLAERLGGGVPVGAVDITLYRDDLRLVAETPIVRGSELGFDINGRIVILVDDVIFTGRTVRAALAELLDYGRPRAIQLAVLVDRGHRELPIAPDFTGRLVKTRRDDIVDILLSETDGRDEVTLTRR
uniref:Bifunctional protein PyrR n=1 Tax=candidate division WOR-3 bacterium TaxID=2052148 RepID=A0A7C4GG70_UNCW3